MEINVKLTIEAGASFKALVDQLTPKAVAAPAAKAPVVLTPKMAVVAETAEQEAPKPARATPAPKAAVAAPAPKAVAAPAPKAAVAPKPAAPKPAPKAVAVNFEDLEPAEQLEALKAHATKHTKKGKTADIKALVANYGAERVSELDPDYYIEFNDVLTRYSDGESVEDIFPNAD